MDESMLSALPELLADFPRATYLLCAAHGEKRAAVVIEHASRCANDPPMLLVALEKGQAVSPVIRDARRFVLAILSEDESAIARRFSPPSEISEDPFIGMPALITPGGITVPRRVSVWFECELARHLDVEADCEIYIGAVRAAERVDSSAGGAEPTLAKKATGGSVLRSANAASRPKRKRSSRRA